MRSLNKHRIQFVRILIPALDCFQAEIVSTTYDENGAFVGEMLTKAVEITTGQSATTPSSSPGYTEMKPSTAYAKALGVAPCETCGKRRDAMDREYEKAQTRP